MREGTKSEIIFFTLVIVTNTFLLLLLVLIPPIVLKSSEAACISYSSTTKTITVSCASTTWLTDVNNVIHDSNILKKESNGIWLLSSNIVVSKYGNFVIDSTDSTWLKIISSSTNAYGLINYGSLKIDSVKITSWNVHTNTYASTSSDGKTPRAYIVAKSGATGKTNILNSEIAYLGRDVSGEHGLDYYGSDGSLIQNNNIHHNWRAFYSAGVGGLTFTKNVVHDNLQYGIDPHSGTHDMYITYNKAYNNNHGIICSVMCYNIRIENNELYNNKRDGIYLDAGSHHVTIANNKIYNEDEAIQLPSLSYSEVYGNTITDSNYGIVMYTQIGSLFDRDNRCGSMGCVSLKNYIHDNTIKVSNTGILLKGGASSNTIESNTMNGPSAQYGIRVDGSRTSDNIFRYNHISNSDYGILLSTENRDTKFKRNYFDSLIPSGEYILTDSSALKLEDTKFYSDSIMSMDSTGKIVSISKSGVISVTAGSTAQTTKHDTNSQTYSKRLKNSEMITVNTISSTVLSTSTDSFVGAVPTTTAVSDDCSYIRVASPISSSSSISTANSGENVKKVLINSRIAG
jgi:hypothetical protein